MVRIKVSLSFLRTAPMCNPKSLLTVAGLFKFSGRVEQRKEGADGTLGTFKTDSEAMFLTEHPTAFKPSNIYGHTSLGRLGQVTG